MVVSSEVLHCYNTLTKSTVKDLSATLDLPQPYQLRASESRNRVGFSYGYEIGIYTSFFDAGLRFPLDENVESILSLYEILLCRYTPPSVQAIITFIFLVRDLEIPFSLCLF